MMKHADATATVRRPQAPPPQALRALRELRIEDAQIETTGERLYLRGLAPCYRTKQMAARRVAAELPGVSVVNELRVAHGAASDAEVTRAVEAAIRRAAPGAAGRISAHVDAGDAYIGGTAADEEERGVIEAAAWQAPGVMHVHSRIMVPRRREDDSEVAQALGAYINRAVTLPYGEIRITYSEGVASLEGDVATERQREAIEDLIRWHECVTDVINHVRVAPLRVV
ncbi:MAG: BON domain-containing protein [Dehalococcoidia bacterium]